jgi:hypothetical protein
MMSTITSLIRILSLAVVIIYSILGWSKFTNSPIYVDREFRPFFNDFKNDAKKYNVSLNLYKLRIYFVPTLPDTVAARCFLRTNTVQLAENVWQILSTAQKKALIYHELGHCLLLRDHVSDGILYPSTTSNELCPVSVMYPTIDPMIACYDEFEEMYIRELFTNPYNQKVFRRHP